MGVWVEAMFAAAGLSAQPQPLEVSGANAADECQFPGVVAFRAGDTSCTGTMVHPRVMVTAAHCLQAGTPERVRFGETYSPYEHRIDVERCEAYPDYATSQSVVDDLGYCVLDLPVEHLPPVPLVAGCETEHLQPGTIAVIVGFGLQEEDGSFGRKRYAFTTLGGDVSADGTQQVGDDGANACIGDSGGPVLVQLPDGTWRAAGVLVWGPDCGAGANTYRVLADRMAWLEERSGFDLTPCFDEAGEWETSSECAAFDADPRFDGDWIDYCDGERVDPVQSCEPAQIGSSSSSSGAIEGASTTEDPGTDASSSQAAEETIPDGCACATSGDPRDRWSLWLWSLTSACCRPRRRRAASGYAPRTCIGTP